MTDHESAPQDLEAKLARPIQTGGGAKARLSQLSKMDGHLKFGPKDSRGIPISMERFPQGRHDLGPPQLWVRAGGEAKDPVFEKQTSQD